MVDKAAMLLSTDWFAPYWSVIGIGLLVILLSIATSASPQTDQADVTPSKSFAAQHTRGQHLKAKGIRNFGQVTPTLYRGGQPSAEGFDILAHLGINIVVDTGRSKRNETQIKNLGMAYISLPWYCPFPKDEVFARFIKITRENPGKKIFVHCRLGDDRTGMIMNASRNHCLWVGWHFVCDHYINVGANILREVQQSDGRSPWGDVFSHYAISGQQCVPRRTI
jgi:hypothetical protein